MAQLQFALGPESSQSTFSVHWHTVTDITTSYHKDSMGEYVIEQKITKTYNLFSNAFIVSVYDRPLAEHICSESKGDFRRFLTLVVTVSFCWLISLNS